MLCHITSLLSQSLALCLGEMGRRQCLFLKKGSGCWDTYQYRTSSPHSTSNRKCENATGTEPSSQAIRYQALSSVISSRFSRSFQPHSLCSYLQAGRRGTRAAQCSFYRKQDGPSTLVPLLPAHTVLRISSAVPFHLQRSR